MGEHSCGDSDFYSMSGLAENTDTFPKLLLYNYKHYPKEISIRHKKYGIWNQYSWEDCYIKTREIALGMVSLGLKRGDRVCVIGNSEPEWYLIEIAIQAMGAIVVGLYTDAIAREVEYIVSHSGARFIFARDQEQVDKLLEIRDKIPQMEKIIFWEPKGMWRYKIAWIMDIKELMTLGKVYYENNKVLFEESISMGRYDDFAILNYTSGTTGLPKGAMSSYDMTLYAVKQFASVLSFNEDDEYVSFLPPAWVAEQLLGIAPWLALRVKVNFPENANTIWEDLREIGVTYVLLGPAQCNNFLKLVQIRINDSNLIKRFIYNTCLRVGYEKADYKIVKKKHLPFVIRVLNRMAEWICLIHVRDYLGLRFLKIAFTGGSILGPDNFRWFHGVGVNLTEIYGLSEATPLTMHGKDIEIGTIGKCFPGVKVRISGQGELQFKYPFPFKGYYKNEEETQKTLRDGWLSTGDAGAVNENGHCTIYDRVKNMMKLKDGTIYSAPYIENRIKFNPYIKDCLVVGDEEKDYLFAITIIDFDNLGRWAEKNRISYTTFLDLCQNDEVYDLFLRSLQEINKTLPQNIRVRKFVNLYKEFDADEGEMTRSGKIKRPFLYEKYKYLINSVYEGRQEIPVTTEIVYHDGKKGVISANLKVKDIRG